LLVVPPVLFDLTPKRCRRDFYDFEHELEQLHRLYLSSRVVAVLGPRRVGKTSLILTFLNEWSVPNVFVDCRRVSLSSYGASFRGFAEELSRALNAFISSHRGVAGKLLEHLRGVRGVEIDLSMAKASLRWSRRDRVDVVSLLERLNDFAREEGLRVALVLDELQELQPINVDFAKLIAYAYDHLANVVVILSGSQVGLLYDMLKVDDPASPLFGRAVAEIRMGRLSRGEAVDLLSRGFAEAGVEVGGDVIEKAVDVLDGVVGWLTYFGWSYSYKVKDLEEVLNAAAMQEAEEMRRFLAKSRSEKRYRAILKTVAEGKNRWSEIKRSLELLEGIEIDDKNFNELLTRLIKAGFLEKVDEMYKAPDAITARAILKHL
jgi:AAA+ ATPase superfamily predicted ATPase